MRELYTTQYDSGTFTSENLLYQHRLLDPVKLTKSLTWLYGRESDKFPLLMSTEGNGAYTSMKPKMLNDTQYTWDTIGRMKHGSNVVGIVNTSTTYVGLNYTEFEADFEDAFLIKDYSAFSPDGQTQVRINSEGQRIAPNRWRYRMVILGGTAASYITLDNFQNSGYWVMGAPSVAPTKSDGNRSNEMTPGKWTNQFGFHRFSKQITGNIANKATAIEFDLEGGGKTNLWMPFSMKLFELDRRLMQESYLWYSEYNRDEYGQIHTKDPETGEPIPKGAGVKEILTTIGNYDTYSTLTIEKLDSIINRLMTNRVDDTPMEIVLYTGAGGKRMFNTAMQNAASSNSYYEKVGSETINPKNGYLEYGAYFQSYKTIDGKVFTVKEVNLFNHGLKAEQDRQMGRMKDGFPYESFNMVFLDHSRTNDGERNIQLVAEEGREYMTGVYKGMTKLPAVLGPVPEGKILSTRKDMATYEVMTSAGINILNPTTSFWLAYAA